MARFRNHPEPEAPPPPPPPAPTPPPPPPEMPFDDIAAALREGARFQPIFAGLAKLPEVLNAVVAAQAKLGDLGASTRKAEQELGTVTETLARQREDTDRALVDMDARQKLAEARAVAAEERADGIQEEAQRVEEREKKRAQDAELEAGARVLKAEEAERKAIQVLRDNHDRILAELTEREERALQAALDAEAKLDEIAAAIAGRR